MTAVMAQRGRSTLEWNTIRQLPLQTKYTLNINVQDAMNNHGLGHLPQPDNFTTVGNKLGIEINQYNCPINVVIRESVMY